MCGAKHIPLCVHALASGSRASSSDQEDAGDVLHAETARDECSGEGEDSSQVHHSAAGVGWTSAELADMSEADHAGTAGRGR